MPELFDIKPDPGSTVTRKIMGEHVVNITTTIPQYMPYTIGDVIDIYAETFVLNKLPEVAKISEREYQYNMQFESVSYSLAKIQCLFLNEVNDLRKADFSLMGNLSDFVSLVVDNANRVSGGWTAGTVDISEYKNLTFSSENCLQVLSRLAEEFDTEFWIEGRTIHLTKKQAASGLTFEYGYHKGLYDLRRANQGDNIVTRIYAYGSTKNLSGDYRNYSDRLLMPVATGAYIESNVANYGIIEAVQIFEDIYPHRTGTISSVGNHLELFDTGLDFDINAQLIPGTTAKLTFNTGQLSGYTFEINSYVHATKKITLNINKEEKAIEVPSTLLKAAIGDTYVLTDIIMPASYITAAENELKAAAEAYLAKNSIPKVQYSLTVDPLNLKRNNTTLKLGDTVRVIDEAMGVDSVIRIVGLTRSLDNPFLYTNVELAETVTISPIVRQISAAEKVTKELKAQSSTTRKLLNNLGGLAFDDLVALAKLDESVMVGGYLKNALIDTIYLKAEVINAAYIQALELIAEQIKTAQSGRRIQITNDNTLKFYGAAGNLAIEMIEENGVCKLKFYDTAGNVTYEAGQQGITYAATIAESWTAAPLRLVSTTFASTVDDLTDQVETSLSCYKTDAAYEASKSVGTNASISAYYYNAGQNVNSDANRQYEGYKINNTSKTDNVANGWYIRGNEIFYSADAPNGIYNLDFFYLNAGVVTHSLQKTNYHLSAPGNSCSF